MKYLKFLSISAFAIAAISCNANNNQAETTADAASATETPVEAKSGSEAVKVPTSDTQIRPNMKVNKVTVIDLNATWCGPCRAFSPIFDEAAEHFAGKADFYSIDTDQFPQTSNAFDIEAIPTIVFINPNGKIEKHVGLSDFFPSNIDQLDEDAAIQAIYANFCKMIENQIALSKVK